MATIVFYEKPGCGNNTKQKVWLAASGHTVLPKNLLIEKWTAEKLRPFFGEMPVEKWFNPSAPSVKSGEIDPAARARTLQESSTAASRRDLASTAERPRARPSVSLGNSPNIAR